MTAPVTVTYVPDPLDSLSAVVSVANDLGTTLVYPSFLHAIVCWSPRAREGNEGAQVILNAILRAETDWMLSMRGVEPW